MLVIAAAKLTDFAVQLLSAGGADSEEAAIVADSLVQANLRGHDSHGVMRIPFYLQNVKNGRLQAGARLTVVRETPSVLVTD
ncbi:MAG TPA: Ldh family oxidoreductase, partial [Planctomycetaceae bacterium]|nr:Ldh family oxidoreductase [Planctomycetaceae bacterium]